MKTLALLAALLLSTAAFAQDAPEAPKTEAPAPAAAAPAVVQPAPPSKFYLEVDQADLNLLAAAINELPKKLADPLLAKLNLQLAAQTKVKAASEAAVPPKNVRKGK